MDWKAILMGTIITFALLALVTFCDVGDQRGGPAFYWNDP